MALTWIQKQKNKYGIGFSGSRAKKKREDSERKVNTTRTRSIKRGRGKRKEYWNPITKQYQSSPVKAPVTQDHLGRDPKVGAAKRKKVRQNPVSDETLKTVKEKLKAEKMKIKGKGPVKSGEEYGKHLDKQSKKYETKGEGPVRDGKKYKKTLEAHAAKTEAQERAEWEKKTKRSPARRAGLDPDELWEQQKKHRQREKDKKEGKLKREKFDPRRPRGYKRKLVKKTPAELEAERRKKEVKATKGGKKNNNISETVKVKQKPKQQRGFSVKSFPGSFNIA